jgi:acetate kinase
LDGVDAIVFTAGIGENSPFLRQRVCEGLGFLGVAIDEEKNKSRGKEIDITGEDSKVKVLVIPTNEELVIARDTLEIVSDANSR